MPNSPQDMMRAVIANLPAKTGRSFDEWVALTREQAIDQLGMSKIGEIVNWLKREYGLGHSTAFIMAAEALKPADYVAPTDEQIIAAQYAGAKAALRPIFEQLAGLCAIAGRRRTHRAAPDLRRLCPRQTVRARPALHQDPR